MVEGAPLLSVLGGIALTGVACLALTPQTVIERNDLICQPLAIYQTLEADEIQAMRDLEVSLRYVDGRPDILLTATSSLPDVPDVSQSDIVNVTEVYDSAENPANPTMQTVLPNSREFEIPVGDTTEACVVVYQAQKPSEEAPTDLVPVTTPKRVGIKVGRESPLQSLWNSLTRGHTVYAQ